MNFLQIIATLRKFGNYIVGLFPFLLTIADVIHIGVKRVKNQRQIRRLRARLRKSQRAKALLKFFERFYWRTYSKDRLAPTGDELSDATLELIRPMLQLCAVLCLLVPLTYFRLWPISLETYSGFKTSAPGWSVLLWLVAMPCTWACIVIAGALCNRVVFIVAAIAGLWFLSMTVLFCPRSYFNWLLSAAIFVSMFFCEQNLAGTGRRNTFYAVGSVMFVGGAVGIQMMILTPLKVLLSEMLHLPGPLVGIGGGAIMGALLGLAVFLSTKLRRFSPAIPNCCLLKPRCAIWAFSLLVIGYLIAGTLRTDLGNMASSMVSSLSTANNYLWPMWYFIGVGILHKLLASTKVVSSLIAEVIPKRVLSFTLITALLLAVLAMTSESVANFVSSRPDAPPWLINPSVYLYHLTKDAIWSNTLAATTANWFSLVLGFDVLVVASLIVRRRLSSDALVRLFSITCLAWLLMSEYLFQLSSFSKPTTDSVLVLFLFSCWLLWLLQSVGWSETVRSSPLWPSQGRALLYVGIVAIAMLQIQARTSIRDFKIMNELFLTMFRGVIDVGLPYYLFVWSRKTLVDLPVKTSTVLGLFSLGALTSLVFNALEKGAMCGWSLPDLQLLVSATEEKLKTTGSTNIDLNAPIEWFFIRAIVFVCILLIIYRRSGNKFASPVNRSRGVVFLLLAFGSGVASFSKTLVDLPIPMWLTALVAPAQQELTFNTNVFRSYLGWWIPTLLFALVQLQSIPRRRALLLAVAALAVVSNFVICGVFSEFEVYLRAAGVVHIVMAILVGAFVILVAATLRAFETPLVESLEAGTLEQPDRPALDLLDTPTLDSLDTPTFDPLDTPTPDPLRTSTSDSPALPPSAEKADAKPKVALLPPNVLIAVVASVELILVPVAFIKLATFRLNYFAIPSLGTHILASNRWQAQASTAVSDHLESAFTRPSDALTRSRFVVRPVAHKGSLSSAMQSEFTSPSAQLLFPGLSIVNIEPWGRIRSGAVACHFSFLMPLGKDEVPMSGLRVLVPIEPNVFESYTLTTSPSEIEEAQWELAFALKSEGAATQRPLKR